MTASAPLEGIYVVALEQAVAAPFATRQLADLGATVLKVERPGTGDLARHYDDNVGGQSTYFVWANRAKQSIALDIKDPADRAQLEVLISGADVFIQNMAPAAASRAGVDAAALHARYPHLIACDISGYGIGGPRSDDKAYDMAVQAEAGAFGLTGTPEAMARVGFSVADISAAMYALTSVLAALCRRFQTGEGAAIEVSMLESLAEWTAPQVMAVAHTGHEPARSGYRHTYIAPYGLWELSDGRQILIAVQSDREWQAMAELVLDAPQLGFDPRFATPSARIDHVEEVEAAIAQRFALLAADDVVDRLRRARIAYAFARTPLEVWRHEQLAARDRIVDIETPTGPGRTYRRPFNISDMPEAASTVPALGDHDPALVEELSRRRNLVED